MPPRQTRGAAPKVAWTTRNKQRPMSQHVDRLHPSVPPHTASPPQDRHHAHAPCCWKCFLKLYARWGRSSEEGLPVSTAHRWACSRRSCRACSRSASSTSPRPGAFRGCHGGTQPQNAHARTHYKVKLRGVAGQRVQAGRKGHKVAGVRPAFGQVAVCPNHGADFFSDAVNFSAF